MCQLDAFHLLTDLLNTLCTSKLCCFPEKLPCFLVTVATKCFPSGVLHKFDDTIHGLRLFLILPTNGFPIMPCHVCIVSRSPDVLHKISYFWADQLFVLSLEVPKYLNLTPDFAVSQ